jgi:agmatine deiminase
MDRGERTHNFRFPAEFEKQEAIWLGWPVYEYIQGMSAVPLFVQLIEVLVSHVKVKIAAQNEEEKRKIEGILEKNCIPLDEVAIYSIPHNDVWFRDMGPVFLVDKNDNMIVQKFLLNGWGRESLDEIGICLDQMVPNLVAKECGLDLRPTELISEGGDREFNGKGTMITVEAVELQRNPDRTRGEIEKEFKRIFNLKKVIWLKKGLYEDDQPFDGMLPGPDGVRDIMTSMPTGGHIDEHCRFVAEDTVLVAEVSKEEAQQSSIAAVNRSRLEENVAILESASDQDGKPLRIVRIPLPDPLFATVRKGDAIYDQYHEKYRDGFIYPLGAEIKIVAASSYNNFLITNGAVLAPHYWKPGLPYRIKEKDQKAREVLQGLFPGREIYTFDVMPLNLCGGGIHCITQQQPLPIER